MTLAELAKLRPDLADVHYAGIAVDGAYFDEASQRWTLHVTLTRTGEFLILYEARCHPSCIRACGRPYVWVEDTHRCCEGCIADPSHRYQTVHE